jgi:hypothetical protein
VDGTFACCLTPINGVLVALCWLPPFLPRWFKVGLTLAYLANLVLVLIDLHDGILAISHLLGLPSGVASLVVLGLASVALGYTLVLMQLYHLQTEPLDRPPQNKRTEAVED